MILERDEQLTSWIREYYDRLTYIAFTYVRNQNQAEDVVQESFVKGYRSFNQLNDPSRPFPWLVRIVINECHTATRKSKRECPTELLPEKASASAEDVYVLRAENQEVYAAITSLSEKYRTPIILFYFEDLSIREIADALNLGEGTVKTRLFRGRERLKKILRRGESNELGNNYSTSKA